MTLKASDWTETKARLLDQPKAAVEDRLLNENQAADRLGIAAATLSTWRSRKTHDIPFYRIGGRVRYKQSDLDEWLETRRREG